MIRNSPSGTQPGGTLKVVNHDRSPAARVAALSAGFAGAVMMTIGTFLPWVRSGEVDRNSFQMAGVLDRTDFVTQPVLRHLVDAWPYVTPLVVLPALFAAFRLWRTTAVIMMLIGVGTSVLMGALLIVLGGRSVLGVSLRYLGPGLVLAGAVVLTAAGVWLLMGQTRRRARAHRDTVSSGQPINATVR